jgi:uncharacterized protein YdbL (DUF1318 family)
MHDSEGWSNSYLFAVKNDGSLYKIVRNYPVESIPNERVAYSYQRIEIKSEIIMDNVAAVLLDEYRRKTKERRYVDQLGGYIVLKKDGTLWADKYLYSEDYEEDGWLRSRECWGMAKIMDNVLLPGQTPTFPKEDIASDLTKLIST